MNLETKTLHIEVKDLNEAEGIASFYAAAFNNLDSDGDVTLPGAFAKSLNKRLPKLVADHEWKMTHKLGKVLGATETNEGLLVEVKFNLAKQIARDVFSDLMFDPEGAEFSFGYNIPQDGAFYKDGVRYLKEVDLFEVSPVLIGANGQTRLVGVKSTEVEEKVEEVVEEQVETPDYSDLRSELAQLQENIENILKN